jgi:PAS domain S-box-containing protein
LDSRPWKVFYDAAGEPLRMVGINVDVTEDKRAAEALAESERKLKLMHDNTSDGIALLKIGSDGMHIDSVNLSLLRAIGLAREEIEGRLVAQLLPEPHRRALIAKCRQAIGSSVPVTFDYEAPLNSEGRCAQIALVPIASVTGHVTHLRARIKDVTAAKHIERLQQLEAKRKDEFLAMLAHELRNPLTPISSIAHLLTKQECTTAQVQEFTSILQRQAQQLTRMVDDLLDVSRITRGVIELRTEVVDLVEVLRDAHEAMMPALQSKG